jgi:parallel beta-helix repeat protein
MGIQKLIALKKLLPLLILLSLLLLALKYPEPAMTESLNSDLLRGGFIRITPEGTIEGTDKISQNKNIYTLTGDLTGDLMVGDIFISIECDGVVFDGDGKTIQGTSNGIAIVIYGCDVTIKNTRIVNFGTGIEMGIFTLVTNNCIVDNYFETRYWSLVLRGVDGFVSGNTFNAKNGNAVQFWTDGTTFTHNKFIDCGLNVMSPGVSNMLLDNTINGKPLVFLEGQSNQVIDGANQVFLVNCTDMVVKNVVDIGLSVSIQLFATTGTKVTDCKTHIELFDSDNNLLLGNEFSKTGGTWQAAAIKLSNSNHNMITQNSIAGITCCGILCVDSEYNRIEKNVVSSSGVDNRCSGISLGGCNNYIYENDITSEDYGIVFNSAEYNYVFKNHIRLGKIGISMSSSLFNDVFGNTIYGAIHYAVCLESSDCNNFYWNSFKDNAKIYEIHESYWMTFTNFSYFAEYNKWDNGEEGNYWSNYTTGDDNETGINKTPHTVYENFVDNYPLSQPYDINKIHVTFKGWDDVPTNPTSSPDSTYNSNSISLLHFAVIPLIAIIVGFVVSIFIFRSKKRAR